MIIDVVSRCDRRLNFGANAVWPEALPAVAWDGIWVAGFNRTETDACLLVSCDEQSLERLLAGLYPRLGFIELSRLAAAIDELQVPFDWRDFSSRLGFRWSDDWPALFKILRETPVELVEWFKQREVAARDLAPILALKDESQLAHWFTLAIHILKFQPSKSDGIQVLEWLVDLLLAVKPVDFISSARTFAEMKDRLRAARFPMAAQQERSHSDLAAKLPWPPGAKTGWVRNGDRAGLEIRLFAKSPGELEKQITSLRNAASEWANVSRQPNDSGESGGGV